ncbi:hypothetical protein [Paenibacillus polymyxa]|uniref:hypothetical protein n=1 Tax=Paenibacillus polymyxa TaxID=1406 RepID=UPI002ED201F6
MIPTSLEMVNSEHLYTLGSDVSRFKQADQSHHEASRGGRLQQSFGSVTSMLPPKT